MIDTVISYYEQHVSHEKLADAYYYKADLLCEKHAFQEAIAFINRQNNMPYIRVRNDYYSRFMREYRM